MGIIRVALISPSNTYLTQLTWETEDSLCPYRWLTLQFWDEAQNPLDQPWETPEEFIEGSEQLNPPGIWTFDLHDLPNGFRLVPIPEKQQDEYGRFKDVNLLATQWDEDSKLFIPQPGHKRGKRVVIPEDHAVERVSWVRGGEPAYKIKENAEKTEYDIPELLFTHVDRYRKAKVTPLERQASVFTNIAFTEIGRRK